jgi:hypothetical protein
MRDKTAVDMNRVPEAVACSDFPFQMVDVTDVAARCCLHKGHPLLCQNYVAILMAHNTIVRSEDARGRSASQ